MRVYEIRMDSSAAVAGRRPNFDLVGHSLSYQRLCVQSLIYPAKHSFFERSVQIHRRLGKSESHCLPSLFGNFHGAELVDVAASKVDSTVGSRSHAVHNTSGKRNRDARKGVGSRVEPDDVFGLDARFAVPNCAVRRYCEAVRGGVSSPRRRKHNHRTHRNIELAEISASVVRKIKRVLVWRYSQPAGPCPRRERELVNVDCFWNNEADLARTRLCEQGSASFQNEDSSRPSVL